ncbi:MAG: GH92 family glycosyl hydrolase [Paludibacteraceae bacterium]|nr:GH92 family glycosyl hydrolase [Paludibacteraceae bacterium]
MKKYIVLFFYIFFVGQCFSFSPVDSVNTLMGTASTYNFSHGNTYPAVAMPWGMNFWSAQTGENGSGWMYTYSENKIRGFRQTHQPSPWINDYGTFSIMPLSGDLQVDNRFRGREFSHDNEVAKPYLYQVRFNDGTQVKMTSTERGAIFVVKFAENKRQFLVLDAYKDGCGVEIDTTNSCITGYTKSNSGGVPSNFANYFAVDFDHEIVDFGTRTNDSLMPKTTKAEHFAAQAYVEFDLSPNDSLIIRVASSFVSKEQALLNFEREVKNRSFSDVMLCAKNEWNEKLGRIRVGGEVVSNTIRTFYSCLYRTLLFPRRFFEYDGENKPIYYSPYDGKIHSGVMYTDNGFWDTFRAVHPLFTLLYPEVTEGVLQSLLNTYDESGFLPEWASPGHRNCMIGNNSLSLIADAWQKGFRNIDKEKAFKAMLNQTLAQGSESSVGRNGYEDYHKLGYVPYPDYYEASAKTLEYAYADWCLATFAESIGERAIAKEYFIKSQNYRNLFDSNVGFMRAKNKKGEWIEPFDATEWGGPFTEGCSWHYTWSVFHDVEGLAQLMGGYEVMSQRLDSMFSAPNTFNYGTYGFVIHEIAEMVALNMGQYAHGNQPVQHAIYLYNYLKQPWKAQQRIREVMCRLYSATPDGYCGDEDNGQTSAWYVFSALGFYPVCPGTAEYVLGSPLFQKATLTLPSGKTFEINASNNSLENVYIKHVLLNGKTFEHNYLTHKQIVSGGKFDLKMSNTPNKKRGVEIDDLPYSYTEKKLEK